VRHGFVEVTCADCAQARRVALTCQSLHLMVEDCWRERPQPLSAVTPDELPLPGDSRGPQGAAMVGVVEGDEFAAWVVALLEPIAPLTIASKSGEPRAP